VRPAAYREPLRVLSGTHTRTAAASRKGNADSRPSTRPPSRRHAEASAYGRAPSWLKPPLDRRRMPRAVCGAARLRRRGRRLHQPPSSVKQTLDTAAQRSNLLQNSSKGDAKDIKKRHRTRHGPDRPPQSRFRRRRGEGERAVGKRRRPKHPR